jgi:hypothetical protein
MTRVESIAIAAARQSPPIADPPALEPPLHEVNVVMPLPSAPRTSLVVASQARRWPKRVAWRGWRRKAAAALALASQGLAPRADARDEPVRRQDRPAGVGRPGEIVPPIFSRSRELGIRLTTRARDLDRRADGEPFQSP